MRRSGSIVHCLSTKFGSAWLVCAALLACSREHYMATGDTERAAGRHDAALAAYRQALESSLDCGEKSEALHRIGDTYRLESLPAAAADSYLQAAMCNGQGASIGIAIAGYRAAIEAAGGRANPDWCQSLFKVIPESSASERARVLTLEAQLRFSADPKDTSEPIRLLRRAWRLEPDPRAYLLLAQIYAVSGADREAQSALAELVARFPSDPQGQHALGLFEWSSGDYNSAAMHLRNAAIVPEYAATFAAFSEEQAARAEIRQIAEQESQHADAPSSYDSRHYYEYQAEYSPAYASTGDILWEAVKPTWTDFIPVAGWLGKAHKLYKAKRAYDRTRRLTRVATGLASAAAIGSRFSRFASQRTAAEQRVNAAQSRIGAARSAFLKPAHPHVSNL